MYWNKQNYIMKIKNRGNSLAVQQLGLHAFTWVPGRRPWSGN